MVRKADLPDDLKQIVKEHDIPLKDDLLAHDMIFTFLQKNCNLADVICASHNTIRDPRFKGNNPMGLNPVGQIIFDYTANKIAELVKSEPTKWAEVSRNLNDKLSKPLINVINQYIGASLEDTPDYKITLK